MSAIIIALALGGQSLDFPPGDRIAPGLPEVTSWHFAEIDRKPTGLTGDIFKDDAYAIDFVPGAFVGYGGCNRFAGSFSRIGDLVTIKPSGSTQRRCDARTMALEQELFKILSNPVHVSMPTQDTLLFVGPEGTVRLNRTKE